MEILDGKQFIPQVKELISEYASWLNRDLSFQHLEEELQDPALKYTAPAGELLVAVENGTVRGMVAYHRHNALRCEMKRLYVRPDSRGMQIGERLVQEIIAHARQAGYREMVLDTITPLTQAINLYRKHGFTECAPYYHNPMNDVIYMHRLL